ARLHRFDLAGDRPLDVDVVAAELEEDAAALARVGEPGAGGGRGQVAPGRLGAAEAAADQQAGQGAGQRVPGRRDHVEAAPLEADGAHASRCLPDGDEVAAVG